LSKDPNYAIKIEKAIAKKYGEEAIQHPKKRFIYLKLKNFTNKTPPKQMKLKLRVF